MTHKGHIFLALLKIGNDKRVMKTLKLVAMALAMGATVHLAPAQTADPANTAQNSPAQNSTMILGNIRVLKVEGSGGKILDSAGNSSPLKEGAFIRQGTTIKTGKENSVTLLFDNGTTVNVKPDSDFSIDSFAQDPFNSSNVDYQTAKSEPSSSVTRLKVSEGTIVVDIAKLKKNSSFQIATPVGSAGIRGTSLGITSNSKNQANPVTLAVTTGVVQMKTAAGSRAVGGGQSVGVGSTGGFNANPPGAQQLQTSTGQTTAAMQQSVPPNAFQGVPPPAPAPPAAGSTLSAAQMATVQAASEQGTDALVAAVEALAAESPEAAADIAAAAADALPTAATNVAVAAATVAPAAAAQIAASVAQVAPAAAPQIASSVAAAVPAAAVQVAQSVASAAPQAATAIAAAVIAAVPTANATAISAATQAGSQQSTQPGGGNQPANTGDQGTSTQGQSLPGATGGTTGGSGTPPRPTPPPVPTPTPASN